MDNPHLIPFIIKIKVYLHHQLYMIYLKISMYGAFHIFYTDLTEDWYFVHEMRGRMPETSYEIVSC